MSHDSFIENAIEAVALAPSPGDIVWCNFPWHDGTAKYPRPCLVVASMDVLGAGGLVCGKKYKVVYGTTAHLDKLYPGEFILLKDDSPAFQSTGLGGTTKFSFSRVVDLDYTPLFFPRSPRAREISGDGRSVGSSCVMGMLPASLMPAVIKAKSDYAHTLNRRGYRDGTAARAQEKPTSKQIRRPGP